MKSLKIPADFGNVKNQQGFLCIMPIKNAIYDVKEQSKKKTVFMLKIY